ncbi:copper homeostasis protein CutC [Naematelia encephala]|uniref:Copper homeostasis protein cutC homolog n=1 Tax=Naematelia encephala TaxID=71784 RepID=A0A1Y2BF62_9TREE|nr:copper homeostasis protein CutC [Naematelia encephala]
MGGTVEVCLDSLASAQIAADIVNDVDNRIELCSNLIYGGGLTPSLGLLRQCATVITGRKFMIMIRPRIGSFMYTPSEVETMLSDIDVFKSEPSVKGFVFGCLLEDGRIDVHLTKRLVDACGPFEVTFHRAFDLTPDWEQAIKDVWSIPGITRILTSGHARTAPQGAQQLNHLITWVSAAHERDPGRGRLTILPGSGIGPTTISEIKERTPNLHEVHLTASSAVVLSDTEINRRGEELGFGNEAWAMDGLKLRSVWEVVKDWEEA